MKPSRLAPVLVVVVGCGNPAAPAPAPRSSPPLAPPALAASVSPPPPLAASPSAVPPPGHPPEDLSAEATFLLPIPARDQAPESPPSGWCGETALQEGLLYLGVWAPQRAINHAGKPSHPDLYATELPVALSALGVRFAFYSGPRGFAPFAAWAREALEEGDPVVAGVKILPTAHPEWGLDHFVLV